MAGAERALGHSGLTDLLVGGGNRRGWPGRWPVGPGMQPERVSREPETELR